MKRNSLRVYRYITFRFVLSLGIALFCIPDKVHASSEDFFQMNNATMQGSYHFNKGVRGECLNFSRPGRGLIVPNLPTVIYSTAGTVSMWVRFSELGDEYNRLFYTGEEQLKNRLSLMAKPIGGPEKASSDNSFNSIIYAFMGGFDEKYTNLYGKKRLIRDQWYHIAVTWNKKAFSLFIDGRLVESRTDHSLPKFLSKTIAFGNKFMGDLDEVMIFDHALSNKEVNNLSSKAKDIEIPTPSFHLPLDGNFEYEVYKQNSEVNVSFKFPHRTYGYFQKGAKISATVLINSYQESARQKKFKIDLTVCDIAGKNVLRKVHNASVNPGKNAEFEETIFLEECGLYWLKISVLDNNGKILKHDKFPFAIIVNLPSVVSISPTFPLGGHQMSGGHMPMGRYLGMKWDRFCTPPFFWPAIERSPGRFDWQWVDQAVKEAVKEGTEIIYTIHGVPGWASSAPTNLEAVRRFAVKNFENPDKWKKASNSQLRMLRECFPPKNIAQWENFIRKLVSRYKGMIKYWEIINEPDAYMPFFAGTPEQYATLLKSAYQTIHSVDSDAKVLGFCLCHEFWINEQSRWIGHDFLTRALKAGAGDYFDIFSYHNYYLPLPNHWMDKRKLITHARTIVNKYTERKIPFWNTETGFAVPAFRNEEGRPLSFESFERYRKKENRWLDKSVVTEHLSAAYEIQANLLELASGAEKVFLYFGNGVSYGLHPKHGGGDYQNCPAPMEKGVAYAAMAKVLNNVKTVHRLNLDHDDIAGVLIDDLNGNATGVLWANKAGICVSIPIEKTVKVTAMDFLGNSFQLATQGNSLVIKLNIEPIYVFNIPKQNWHADHVIMCQ